MRMEDQDILPGDIIGRGIHEGKTVTRIELDPETRVISYKVGGQWLDRMTLLLSFSQSKESLQIEFVNQEWKEKAHRRNPEKRKWVESVDYELRMMSKCCLCGERDCWRSACVKGGSE